MSALRGRRESSPPPLKPFNPADEGTPPRARRHQRRRDDEYLQSQAPASKASTTQSRPSAPPSLRFVPDVSPSLPLMQKNAVHLQNALLNDRGGLSNDTAIVDVPAKRITRASSRSESRAESSSVSPSKPQLAKSISAAHTEEAPGKQTNARASTVKANKMGTPKKNNEKLKASAISYSKGTPSSRNTIPEVVIYSSAKKAKPIAGTNKKKKAAPHSESRDEKEEHEPETKSVPAKKGKKPAAKEASAPKKKEVPEAPRKQGGKGGAAKKSIISTSNKGNDKEPAQDPPRGMHVAEPDKSQQVIDAVVANEPTTIQDTHAEQTRPAEQIEQPPAPDDTPLFFDTLEEDALSLRHNIPPSSPGRFVGWHNAAPASSEDDLEYVSPSQYSDHRQQEDQEGHKREVSLGRLGAKQSLPLLGRNHDKVKEAVLAAAVEEPSAAAPMPMSSTPLKQMSTKQATALQSTADSPRTAERKAAKERERLMNLTDSEEESDDCDIVGTDIKESSNKVDVAKGEASARVAKIEKSLPERRGKAAEKKVLPRPRAKMSGQNKKEESISVTADQAKKEEEKSIKNDAKAVEDNVRTARFEPLDEVDDGGAGDPFGFVKSQLNVKELLTKKAMLKKSAQAQPIKKVVESQSQTQSDGQFSVPVEFSKQLDVPTTSLPAAATEDREDSLPPFDAAELKKMAQQKTVDASAAKKDLIEAQFSSDLTALDSDLEIDMLEVVKTQKRGKAKAPEPEPEERQLTIDEILALGQGNDEVLEKIRVKPSAAKGGRKSTGKGRKLQLDDDETNKKTAKPKKAKVLKLTQDEAAVAPIRAKAGAKKKGFEAAAIEMDEFDVPPGMTSANVTSSRVSKRGKKQEKKAETVKVASAVEKKSKPSFRPRPRAAMAPMQDNQDEDWDELPGARVAAPKRAAKGKATNAIREQSDLAAQDSQTQPIITPALRKTLKRPRLAIDSDDEDENENPTLTRQRKEDTSYFDSLTEYELAVENV